MLALVALLFFVALGLGAYAVTSTLRERSDAEEQLKQRLGTANLVEEREEPRGSVLKDLRLSSIEVLNRWLSQVAAVTSLAKMMRQAGIHRRVGEVVLYIPLLASVGVLVGMLGTHSVLVGIVVGAVGAMLPIFIISRMRAQRIAKFSEQLPDALDLVKAALQAGHSFPTALKVVAEEFPPPISEEFDTIAEEMRLGLPMREALQGLQMRVEDPNVPVLIVGVLVVQESGGNLAEVLENVSHTVRERFKLLRDVSTMTAQGRLSGGMLALLPLIVALVLGIVAPEYLMPLVEKPTGRFMIAYAVGSILLGHMMIQRIVKIRV